MLLTLQSNFDKIIKSDGENEYQIPHLNKVCLERLGQLPTNLTVSPEAVQKLEERADGDYEIMAEEAAELKAEEQEFATSGYKPPLAITQQELEDLRREVEALEE
jgi:hypothetical protein